MNLDFNLLIVSIALSEPTEFYNFFSCIAKIVASMTIYIVVDSFLTSSVILGRSFR